MAAYRPRRKAQERMGSYLYFDVTIQDGEAHSHSYEAVVTEPTCENGYEIPKDDNIGCVTITKEYIEGTGGPVIDIRSNLLTGKQEELKEIKE